MEEVENKDAYKIGSFERIQRDFKEIRRKRPEMQVWTRQDMNSVSLRGSTRQGPSMRTVVLRKTYETEGGDVLYEDQPGKEGFWKHRIWHEPRHTTTALYFVTGSSERKSEETKEGRKV